MIPDPPGPVEEPILEDDSLAFTIGLTLRVGKPLSGTSLRPAASDPSSDAISGSLGGGLSLRAGVGYRMWDVFAMYEYAHLSYSAELGERAEGGSHRALLGVGRYLLAPRSQLNILFQVAAGAEAFVGRHLRTSQIDGAEWSDWEIVPTAYTAIAAKWRVEFFHVLLGPYVSVSLDTLMSGWLADRQTNVEAGLLLGVDLHTNSFNPEEVRGLTR